MALVAIPLVVILILAYLIDYPRFKRSDVKQRSVYLAIFCIGFLGLVVYGFQFGFPGVPLISIH